MSTVLGCLSYCISRYGDGDDITKSGSGNLHYEEVNLCIMESMGGDRGAEL